MQLENIKVILRIRPKDKKEQDDDFLKVDRNSVNLGNNVFAFDLLFDKHSSQNDIFENVAKPAVEWCCQGYNSAIFAYGPTNSGKTYTMFGDKNEKGIIPRTAEKLFDILNTSENVVEYTIKCSFIEIYLERIRDLLNKEESKEQLKIRQHPIKGNYAQGLIEKYVYTPNELIRVINLAFKRRATSSTSLNDRSSRSHAVVSLIIEQKNTDGTETRGKLHLVDLAGSENVGRSEAQGVALTEAQMINKSLSALGNVINALNEKREHVPYRDSKLTFLLQDSLGGNSKTIVITAASPSKDSNLDTLNTLKFAKRIKEIKNIPKVNKTDGTINLLKTIEKMNKDNSRAIKRYKRLKKGYKSIINKQKAIIVEYIRKCGELELRNYEKSLYMLLQGKVD